MTASDHLQQKQMYHVTTIDALPSTKRGGINNVRSTKELWSNVDDWDDGAYLWDTPHRAIDYAHGLREMGERPVVLGVSPRGLKLSPDETGDREVVGAFHAPRVPVKNISFPKRYR